MKAFAWKSNIYRRLVIFFILVGIIPVVLLSLTSFRLTQNAIHEKVGRYSAELMTELSDNIEREMMSLENIAIDIAYSNIVQQYFLHYNDMSDAEGRSYRSNIRMDIALKVSLLREITDVYVYLPNNEREVFYGEEGYKFALQEQYDQKFVQDIIDGGGKTVIRSFSGTQQMDNIRRQQDTKKGIVDCLLLGRLVRELNSGDVLGIIVMRVNEEMLSTRLRNIDVGTDADIVIIDSANHRIISSTNEADLPVAEALNDELSVHPSQPDSQNTKLQYLGKNHMAVNRGVESLGWSVICLIPYSYLDSETYTIFRNTLLLLACICAATILGVRAFSKRISQPLTELVYAMSLVKEGDLDVEVVNNSPDEIGQVARSFNRMLEQIRQLLDNVKKKEEQKRKAELAALQAQINPHFLSNTLNTVRCLAHTQKADNIENILVALIELLHVSMDIGDDFITIKKEISYVRSYIEIMSYRNYSNFTVLYEVQPDVEDSLIPKLILQPLVENALIHGLQDKSGGQIIVRVSGDEANLFITIIDNGHGISPDILPTLLEEKEINTRSHFSGIGIPNVNERIKMLFGDRYGLYIESVYLMYTTVEIVLPNLKGERLSDEDNDSGRRGGFPQQHKNDD